MKKILIRMREANIDKKDERGFLERVIDGSGAAIGKCQGKRIV